MERWASMENFGKLTKKSMIKENGRIYSKERNKYKLDIYQWVLLEVSSISKSKHIPTVYSNKVQKYQGLVFM